MSTIKTFSSFLLFNILFYLIIFVLFKPSDDNLFGWVILNLYIILPFISIIYFTLVFSNLKLNLALKVLLFICNVIIYQLSIYLFFNNSYLDDSFSWILLIVPSIIGMLVGVVLYNRRISKLHP